MFEKKVAIVTGASRGIGQHLVKRFLRDGAQVVACARTFERLEALESEIDSPNFKVIAADATNPADVKSVAELANAEFGGVDILVNNAGAAGPTTPIEDMTLEDWNSTVASNLNSAFLFIRECVPDMKAKKSGVIVNIGSMTGKKPLVFRTPYAAAKMALIGLTRTLAEELGPAGIRINTVCPGTVTGERLNEVLVEQADKRGISMDAITDIALSGSPLKSFVAADDVAELVVFLASEKSRHMTGQDINISAGQITW